MCARLPQECAAYNGGEPLVVHLTEAAWRQIDDVNRQINRDFDYVKDEDQYDKADYWNYMPDGIGDCEDFVLEKRRRLIAAGFPRRALLLTIVGQGRVPGKPWNELHAVLMVRTDAGDKIMDLASMSTDVRDMMVTSYSYLFRQSQRDPNEYNACDRSGRKC